MSSDQILTFIVVAAIVGAIAYAIMWALGIGKDTPPTRPPSAWRDDEPDDSPPQWAAHTTPLRAPDRGAVDWQGNPIAPSEGEQPEQPPMVAPTALAPVEPARCPPWSRPLSSCIERMKAIIVKTCGELAKIKSRDDDPILTAEQAQAYLQMHSAFSRHGLIIEQTLREALRDSPHFEVWREEKFQVSVNADSNFTALSETELRRTEMPYGLAPQEARRDVQVDLIVYDRRDNVIRAYEVKRGAGHFGSYAQRAGSNNILAVGVYLKSYAESKGFRPLRAESHLISYYGSDISRSRQGGQMTLHREHLNQHFGIRIVEKIEAATAEFRHGLQAILIPQHMREAAE
jgi:hypothetical protein